MLKAPSEEGACVRESESAGCVPDGGAHRHLKVEERGTFGDQIPGLDRRQVPRLDTRFWFVDEEHVALLELKGRQYNIFC